MPSAAKARRIFILICALMLATCAAARAQTGSISGTVTAAAGGAPISGMTLFLYNSGGGSVPGVNITNASGVYTISNLTPGNYYLQTSSQGFHDQPFLNFVDKLYTNAGGITCPGGACTITSGTPIAVTAGATTSGINFSLAGGGLVSGTVTAGGASVDTAMVTIYNASGVFVGYYYYGTASGSFSVPGLPTGTYYATASLFGFVKQLYSGFSCPGVSCSVTGGTAIAVTAGATTPNVNFALVSSGAITGTVTRAVGGTAISSLPVQVFNAGGTFVTTASTNASGNYTASGLAAGNHFVRTANALGYIDQLYNGIPCSPTCTVTSGTAVAVTGGATTPSINFSLAAIPVGQGQGPNFGTFSIGQVEIPLAATNGTGPYTWSLAPGSLPLPPGLSLRTDRASWFPGNASSGIIGVATAPGTYTFTLRVTDASAAFADQICTLKISPLAIKDLWTLPDGFVGVPYTPYALTALGNTGAVTWTVTGGSLPAGSGLSISSAGVVSGTPTTATNYNGIHLSLFDAGTGDTVTRDVNIFVNALNIATPGVLPNAVQGAVYGPVTLTAGGGSGTGYTFTRSGSFPSDLTLSPAGVISGTIGGFAFVNNYQFSVRVTDSLGASYSKNMSLTLVGVPPTLPSIRVYGNFEDCAFGVNCGRALGVSGGRAPFVWSATGLPAGMSIRSGSGLVSTYIQAGDAEIWGTPTQLGLFNVQVTVTDADLKTATSIVTFRVSRLSQTDYLVNGTFNTPYLNGAVPMKLRVIGGTLPYTLIDLGVSTHLPAGLTLDTGTFIVGGTPTESGNGNPFRLYFRFTDSSGSPDGTFRNTNYFSIFNPSTLDISTNSYLGTVTAGSNFSTQLFASGPATITWSLLSGSLPTGTPNVTLSSSGVLSGTPTALGSYSFIVKATDSANSANFAQRQFTMIVTPMSLTSNTFLPNGFVGVPFSSTLVVTGATGAVTWTVDPGNPLPPGFAPPVGGVLSGTPTQRGQYTFSMTGADTAGHIVQRQFTISIYLNPGEIPLGLIINNTSGNPSFNAIPFGSNQFGLSAGGGTPPYHYSVTSGAVPGFRVLDGPPLPTNFNFPAGYAGVATVPGVYNTVFRVTDSLGAFFERTATFTVLNSIVTSQSVLPRAAVGVPYAPLTLTLYPDSPIQRTNSGIPNQVNGWGLISGALPPGMSLSPAGLLTGTPSVGALTSYSPQFTRGSIRTWTDFNANSIPECNFTNFAANGECGAGSTTNPLRFTESLNVDPFGITTSGVLPQGVVGTPYPTTTLTASNCGTGCNWFVSTGSLPSGLTLNGATGSITGTPTGAFNNFFTVTASGSNGSAVKVFSVLIANNTPGPLTIATAATQGYSTIGFGTATLLSASGGTPPYAWSIQSGTPPPGVTLQGPGRSPGCQTVEQSTGICTVPLPPLAADATLSSTTGPGQTYLAGRIMGLGISQAYDFTLAVTDGAGRTVTKAIHWLVTPLALSYNNLPIIGTTLQYNVPYTQALLALGGTGVYTFANTTPMPPGLTLSAAGVVSGTPTNTGSFNTSVQVTDNAGVTGIFNVAFTISAPPPATTTINLGLGITQTTQRGTFGNVVSFNLSPSGGTGPYTITALTPLPAGFAILTGDATLSNNGAPSASYFLAGTPLADGVFVFTLRVQDSGGVNFGVRTITLTVAPFHLVTPLGLPDASVGVAYSQQLQAWDNSGPVTWALAPTSDPLPPGMTLSPSGLLSGPPTAGPNTLGTYSPTINTTASGVTVSNRFTLRVSNVTITNAPVMPTGQIGVPYGAYTFTASGGAGPITWSATGLPSGLTLSPTTGALTGTPTSGGTSNIVVTATDGVVPFSKRFGLIIRGANPPVNLTSGTGNLGDVVLGQNLSVTLNVSGGMPPYTWTVAPGSTLPPGLNLLSGLDLPPGNNPTATVLAGAPSIAGAYTFDLIATDGVGQQVRRTLTLHVSPVAVVGNLTGNFQNVLRNPTTGVFYSQRVTAVGGTGPYTFTMAPSSLVNDMLPPGLNLSADGVISGTATSTGVYTFVLTVHDASGQTFARTFTVTVANSSGLFVGAFNPSSNSFSTVNPPDTWVGSARSYTDLDVQSLSGPVNMYAWSLAPGSGPLPPGISVVPSDDIFGGPSLGGLPTSPGTYVYTLRATDTGNAASFVDHTFTQRIAPMQIVTPPMGFLGLIFPGVADLPPAQVGVHYSFLFRMTGGTGPFTFTESPFAPLPAGFNLSPSGVLSGTPVSPGGYLISPIVTDAAGYALNVNTTLIVTTPGVPVAMNVNGLDDETLTPGAVGEAYNVALNDFRRYGTPPFTWSLASGTLPPGLNFVNGSDGTPDHLAGTPTTAGEYAFALMVSDSNGQSIRVPATGEMAIGVGALRLAPPALPDGRLALPDGVKGKPYGPVSLVASNGTPPYQYHLMPGFSDLPVGLTLDPATGVLSGTPTSAGNFVVIVYAIDAAFDGTFDHFAYRIYRVRIANPPQELRNSDFDAIADGKRDVGVYRPSEGNWYVLRSGTNTLNVTHLGSGTDILVQGDYDGDGQADWAVYHPTGQWEVILSSTGATITKPFGLNTDIAVPGDYDGDGKTDFTIFRPSTGTWYYLPSSTGSPTPITVVLGASGDVPVPGDYDGDGRTDAAIYRSSTGEWLYIKSGTGLTDTVTFGGGADRPVPRDYDGDGRTDIAVYHPTGLWSIRQSSTGVTIDIPFGLNTDVPVPGDYDGDGLADLTIYRPSEGKWYIRQSTTGTVQAPVVLGQSGDRPLVGGLPTSTSGDSTRARDIDGDRKADLMVYRPSEGKWYTLKSASHYATAFNKIFGLPTDTPVLGDWDGDGRTDFGVYHRTGQWEVLFSSTGYTTGTAANFGLKTDRPVPGDYDGDGRTDYAVYRPSNNTWFVLLSSTNYTTTMTQVWGVAGDVPVPGDYDGDGQADFAVYRRTTGTWLVRLSATGTTLTKAWGGLTDVPVPGDYDGDGKTDLGVFHLTGQWEVLLSGNNYTTNTAANFGLSTDIPKPGDYDGDGRTDYAVWRPVTGQWFILLSSTNYTTTDTAVLGLPTDQAVPGANFSGAIVRTDATRAGDYDGDGQRDVGVYTPAGGWVVRPSSTNYTTVSTFPFGTATDKPVPGDYDGDGRTDYAIFRPSDTTWYISLSSTNFATLLTKAWGLATDLRVPGDYDGDGKTDIAVYHTGSWQILKSSTNFTTNFTVTLGVAGDRLVPGDYDGDGKTDVGVYRPSEGKWYLLFSSTAYASGVTVTLGVSGDTPVPGDYDGDGKTDVAVFHTTGQWEAWLSSTNFTTNLLQPWGASTDIPAPADYDGDGQVDFAIYRPSESKWYVLLSTTNYTANVAVTVGTPLIDLPLPPP